MTNWQLADLDDKPGLVMDYYGLAITMDRDGSYEVHSSIDLPETAACRRVFRSGDRVIVAGAGGGSLSACLAVWLGVDAVLSYEPHRQLAESIRRNIRVGGRHLRVINAALGIGSGPVDWTVDRERWGQSHITAVGEASDTTVDCLAINQQVQQWRATALCLDIEGMEELVLPALDLAAIRALVVDWHAPQVPQGVLDRLRAHGFEVDLAAHCGGANVLLTADRPR